MLNSKSIMDKEEAYKMIKEDKKKFFPNLLGLVFMYVVCVIFLFNDIEPAWFGMILILGGAIGLIWLFIDHFKEPWDK